MQTRTEGYNQGFRWKMYSAEESGIVLARLQHLLSKESENNFHSRNSPKLKKASMATSMIDAAGTIFGLLPKSKEKSDYNIEVRFNNNSDNLFVPIELTSVHSGFRIQENHSICPPGEDTTLKMTFQNNYLPARSCSFQSNFLLSDERGKIVEFKIDFAHDSNARWVMHTMKFAHVENGNELKIDEINNPYSLGEELRLFRLISTESDFSCALAFFSNEDNALDSKVTVFLMPWLADADNVL